jgi:hypothetical protein
MMRRLPGDEQRMSSTDRTKFRPLPTVRNANRRQGGAVIPLSYSLCCGIIYSQLLRAIIFQYSIRSSACRSQPQW